MTKKKIVVEPVVEPETVAVEPEKPTPVKFQKGVVYAYLNYGRWLVVCPKCKNQTQINIADKNFICYACNPAVIATAKELVHTTTKTGITQHIYRDVPDLELREKALESARANGEVYKVMFPVDKERIVATLMQLHPSHQNWAVSHPDIVAAHPEYVFDQSVQDLKDEIKEKVG
jgi:hypothetical protein